MTDAIWQESPSLPLLQWLSRGSLKQNLLQAMRLWVWLRLLYGHADERLDLPHAFTYAQWRNCFFGATHPGGEHKPPLHDPTCPCAKSAAAWLFHPELSASQPQWEAYRNRPDGQRACQDQFQQFQQALTDYGQFAPQLESLLSNSRLFGATRRTLYGDLRILADIHWLTQTPTGFEKVSQWPDYPRIEDPETSWASHQEVSVFTQPDLAAIAENLSRSLGEERRFFVHVDYVVSRQKLDQVDDWQTLLAELWQQSPIPPIQLYYRGATTPTPIWLTVYPVCIYYYRRGPYLCAYGQVPGHPEDQCGWRNYRLDRILALEPVGWDHTAVAPTLRQLRHTHQLPTPETIETAMDEAWGFDYYQPSQLLLMRFDQEWDRRYIRDTIRHTTFNQVPYDQVGTLIQQHTSGMQQSRLLELWQQRSPQDAYYQAQYRQNDPNVRQRLRAWRPHVEILLPWDLRQRTIEEITQEMTLYDL
jgi:CRISPR-associated protein (TIGR03985 family)